MCCLFTSLSIEVTLSMAKKKPRRKTKNKKGWKEIFLYEVVGLLMFAVSCLAMAKLGAVGATLVDFARFFAGDWYMVIFIYLIGLSFYYIWKRKQPNFFDRRMVGLSLLFISLLLLSHVKLFTLLSDQGHWKNTSVILNTWQLYKAQLLGTTTTHQLGGGMIGAIAFAFFYILFDPAGTELMSFFLIIISIILITGKSLRDVFAKIFGKISAIINKIISYQVEGFNEWKQERKTKRENNRIQRQSRSRRTNETNEPQFELSNHQDNEQDHSDEPIIHDFNEQGLSTEASDHTESRQTSQEKKTSTTQDPEEGKDGEEDQTPPSFSVPEEVENESYLLPSFDLLHIPPKNTQLNERSHIAENVKKLERTFESFGVSAKVKKVHLGPAVTKYEVYPDIGVKVSRIVNLSDDLALALAAKEIRIEAPIPGKSAVGIEVPNQEVAMVSLREVLESDVAKKETSRLSIGLGRDISGEPVLADLSKMPHLLVAGATGSGKSVCINGIITSILMRTKPHEVKLLMIDPKMVELNVYNGVPHLLTPVVTDSKKASQALKKVVSEMERRYELFSHSGTRNLEGYNNYIKKHNESREEKQPLMPYIVVIVDELADLMMVASKDVEDAITRLAQMARAAGIHLIIATQRPSVDVITGVIKANIPSRIAFSVSSQTDSRTILDMGGADKLLGKGDMLFLPIGASKPTRIQGAFLTDDEVENIVDFVISQQKAQYQEHMIPTDEPEQKVEEVDDELYDDAVQLVTDMQTASVSMLQRRFRVGYTRAARLIDAMEARGIVGPYEGSKPRTVLITKSDDEASAQ